MSDADDSVALLWRGGNPVELTALEAALRDAGLDFMVSTPGDYENTISSRTADRLYYGVPNFDIRVQGRDLVEGQRILESVQNQFSRDLDVDGTESDEKPAAEGANITEHEIAKDWDPTTASVNVWSGNDEPQAQFLMDTFRENHIPCRTVEGSEAAWPILILVRPEDTVRAREILREITEGTPPS